MTHSPLPTGKQRREMQMLLSIIILGLLIHNVQAEKEPLYCESREVLEAALEAAKRAAAKTLGEAEASKIIIGLRSRSRRRRKKLCFTPSDFAYFGHVLAKTGLSHDLGTASRVANFARASDNSASAPVAHGATCRCQCGEDKKPWCGGATPSCCASYCTNIFKRLAVGALASLIEDGKATCCRDTGTKCKATQPVQHKQAPAPTKSPNFIFKAPSPSESPKKSPSPHSKPSNNWLQSKKLNANSTNNQLSHTKRSAHSLPSPMKTSPPTVIVTAMPLVKNPSTHSPPSIGLSPIPSRGAEPQTTPTKSSTPKTQIMSEKNTEFSIDDAVLPTLPPT